MAQQTSLDYSTELRRLRDQLGLTQREMAAQLGMRTDSFSRYEQGRRHVPEPTMRLARLLAKKAR